MMQISRIELYKRVSESPLNKVAPRFGITPAALAAICKAQDIPYPGSGYWTRKSLGLAVVLKPLPPSHNPEAQQIDIVPKAPAVRRRTARSRNAVDEASKAGGHPESRNALPVVKERLARPHPMIAKWIADYEYMRRDPWTTRLTPRVPTDLDRRRYRILDGLFRALEARGATISEGEKGSARVTIDGEKIDFQVREKNRKAKISKEDQRSSYLSQELVGTGRLVFAIRTYLRGPHNEEWLETDTNPLESQLPQIVDRLFEGARILKEWHIEQELEREQRQQEAARRADLERLANQERKRRQQLAKLAHGWRMANQIRECLAELKSRPFDLEACVDGRSLADWMEWAEATADAVDPAGGGLEGFFSIIANVKIEHGWG